MSQPRRDDAAPAASAEPTRPVPAPPLPGRAVREQLARGELTTPPVRPDEQTVHLDGPAPSDPDRTLELDGTVRAGVVVGAAAQLAVPEARPGGERGQQDVDGGGKLVGVSSGHPQAGHGEHDQPPLGAAPSRAPP